MLEQRPRPTILDFSTSSSEIDPVRRLWVRVWWRAVCDFVLYQDAKTPERKQRAHEASAWLFGESDEVADVPGALSFEDFCAMFTKDPPTIRRWILNLDPGDICRIGRNLL